MAVASLNNFQGFEDLAYKRRNRTSRGPFGQRGAIKVKRPSSMSGPKGLAALMPFPQQMVDRPFADRIRSRDCSSTDGWANDQPG